MCMSAWGASAGFKRVVTITCWPLDHKDLRCGCVYVKGRLQAFVLFFPNLTLQSESTIIGLEISESNKYLKLGMRWVELPYLSMCVDKTHSTLNLGGAHHNPLSYRSPTKTPTKKGPSLVLAVLTALCWAANSFCDSSSNFLEVSKISYHGSN